MEKLEKISRPPNPRKEANILSFLTFCYMIPTFRKGFRKDTQEEDVPEGLDIHDSKKLGDKLEKSWKKEMKLYQHPSLWRTFARTFGVEFMALGLIIIFLELVVKIAQPIALSQLIKFYTQEGENSISKNKAYMYAGIIVGASFISVMTNHNYMMKLQQYGMKVRVASCSLIYRKSLKLSKSVLGGTTIGKMVNLLSNDVSRFDRVVHHAHYLWLCPLETVIVVGLLYKFAGLASTVGVLFLVLFVPFQTYMGKKTAMYRAKTALKTDERLRLMNEIITGIQVIKMYTWEKSFAKLVAIARRLEIRHIRTIYYIRGLLASLAVFTSSFSVFLTILTSVLVGNPPKAEYVFVIMSFYNILRQTITKHFPMAITAIAETNVSISRITTFLLYDEVEKDKLGYLYGNLEQKIGIVNEITKVAKNNNTVEIQLQNATAKWLVSSSENTLEGVNLRAQSGQLVAIIGPVGGGKTSIINVILKELPLVAGMVNVEGEISYASQEPWVFSGSIRQNILFGQPMVTERYEDVLRVCALEQDILLFPYRDQTLVGERGVTLSGGQRARVSLARAIYKDADIYLLDDPLSAVDTHVGKQLFEECISKFLSNKCTILITHQLQYLLHVNRIFLVENGKITINGTYQELRESGINFTKELHAVENEESPGDDLDKKEVSKQKTIQKQGLPTEVKEHRTIGSVSGDIYMSYFKSAGSLLTCIVIISLFIITQASVSGTDYFLTYWVNMEQAKADQNSTDISEYDFLQLSRESCLYIYSAIIVATLILATFRAFVFYRYCTKASITLHDNMFANIVYAPMRFFHTNSSGRILNRFAKDMGSIDDLLPMITGEFVQSGLAIVGITVMVSLVNPWLFIVTVVITTVFYLLRIVYMRTSRSVKRLEGITRSPVFAHVSASLQGLTTIRAFEAENLLEKEFDNLQNLHSSVWILFVYCSRAFAFWLDLMCVVYIGIVTFSFFLMESTEQYGGNVGLAITQAMSLTGTFQWTMRLWTELENQMTSVERVAEYTKIEHEVDPTEKSVPPSWPEEGNIIFLSVSLRYASSEPYVLKQLNFSIKSKEKIGIVGRTGAGKSSLIYALFQLTQTEGAILIDNIDTTKMALNSLRSKISIIPQEPVLFSGTLRKNLDPFEEYSDIDLWTALEEVELKNVVADLPSGLNNHVSEGGANFSVGQRQLVCLARAIVRKNKILVLDEATANVDPQTDTLIQKTIRRKFADCTVLTIAHRLHTIMDSDKVLVMDAGTVVEFDHPHLLLKNKMGLFSALVQQTGAGMAGTLSKIADKSYK